MMTAIEAPRVIHAREQLPPVETCERIVFLAGPTPRDPSVKSWRPEAIKLFERFNFNGTLLVPEDRNGECKFDYDDQVEWEHEGLTRAGVIMFWLPCDLETLPGFTTNDEWGTWKTSGKCVIGIPPTAQKCSYQRFWAKKLHVPLFETLEETVVTTACMATLRASIASLTVCPRFLSSTNDDEHSYCSCRLVHPF